MNSNDPEWYKVFMENPQQNERFAGNQNSASILLPRYTDFNFPVSTCEEDLPPSIRQAIKNGQHGCGMQDTTHVNDTNSLLPPTSRHEYPESKSPLSFGQRSLNLANVQAHRSAEQLADLAHADYLPSRRVDSLIGSSDDLPNSARACDVSDFTLDDDDFFADLYYNSNPEPLQYHLLGTRMVEERAQDLTNFSMAKDLLPKTGTPQNGNSQNLACPYCADKWFTGVWAYRNLNRHLESVHAPCSSPDGVRHFRCSAPACERTFRREDARLVHERRSHPELKRAPPTPRKRSGEL